MGNEISHKRFCRRSRKSERQATEQKKAGADLSTAQKSLLGNSENPLPKEKSQDAAEEMQNEDTGSETASSSLQCTPKSVPQVTVHSTELQDLGETQQEPEEVETEPVTIMNPDTITYAPSQEGTAAAAGDAEGTRTDLPLQAAGEAEDVVVSQAAVGKCSVVCKKPSGKLCKSSPLCRWLKKLKSSAEKK